MNATREQIYKKAIITPLAYLGANYENREGWLSIVELRRYVWKLDLLPAEIHKTLRQIPVTVIHDRVRWVGVAGEQPTGKGIRLKRLLTKRLWLFRHIPFIRLVGVMNSLAAGCVTEESDIDIFVVAKAGRLWTTRAIVLTLLTMLRWRSRVGNKTAKLSADLFLAEDGLDLSRSGLPTDYLTAYWLADFTPVLYAERFKEMWAANRWIKDFLPVAYRSPRKWEEEVDSAPSLGARLVEWFLRGGMGDKIETVCKTRQIKRIRQNVEKFTAENGNQGLVIVDDSIVKIHFDDSKRDRINRAIEHALAS